LGGDTYAEKRTIEENDSAKFNVGDYDRSYDIYGHDGRSSGVYQWRLYD
jgi:hypothetical protein